MSESQQQTVVVEAAGDLDFDTAPLLECSAATAFESLDGAAGGRLVIDLSKVSFVDSAGLGALVEIKRRAVDSDVSLSLSQVSGRMERLLEVAGLLGVFHVVPSPAPSAG